MTSNHLLALSSCLCETKTGKEEEKQLADSPRALKS